MKSYFSLILFLVVSTSLLLLSTASSPVAAWNYTSTLRRDKRVAVVLGVFGHSEFGKTRVAVTNLVLEPDQRTRFSARVWLELRRVSTAAVARKLKKAIEKEEAECHEIENPNLDASDDAAASSSTATSAAPATVKTFTVSSRGRLPQNNNKQFLKFLSSQPREEDEDLRSVVTFTVREAGMYALVYARCISASGDTGKSAAAAAAASPPASSSTKKLRIATSGHFRVSQWNPQYFSSSSSTSDGGEITVGATYLSVGEAPLPTVYSCFAVLFAVGSFLWYREITSASSIPSKASRIHFAMLLVGVLKAVTLALQAGVYAHRNKTGGTGAAVDVIYVVVAAAKTAILFVIVVLLGSGWSISRASLGDRERHLIVAVLVVQLVVNVALAVIEEGAPLGAEKAASWRTWLRFADLGCALVILIPIVGRAKSQHDAAVQGGDKARVEAQRLAVFRTFYVATFIFLYFTRVIVPYLESHLGYLLVWLPHLLYELAAIIFYFVATRLFHPNAEAAFQQAAAAAAAASPDPERQPVVVKVEDMEEVELDESP